MFVVKDPDLFATTIIPQYFDHNKFSSFARQLNFYGFRKMQAKPIRNADFDEDTAKHVTFFNEKFKRGRGDLLKDIQRSTRGGASNINTEHQKEVEALKKHVVDLEQKISDMNDHFEERLRTMELGMLGRMEQMLLAINQHAQSQSYAAPMSAVTTGASVVGPHSISAHHANGIAQTSHVMAAQASQSVPWDPLPLARARESSIGPFYQRQSIISHMPFPAPIRNGNPSNGPTLPPHPKQKQLKLPDNLKPAAANQLRGSSISGGLLRGLSTESAGLPPWEREFFRQLMLHETCKGANNAGAHINERKISNGPLSDQTIESVIAAAAGVAGVPQLSKSISAVLPPNGHGANQRQVSTITHLPPANLSPSYSVASLDSTSD